MLKAVQPEKTSAFSWKNFIRFEPHIRLVVKSFPNTLTFHPKDMKPTSWALYFRQCCQAFIHPECNWPAVFTKDEVFNLFEQGLQIVPSNADGTVKVSMRGSTSTEAFNGLAIGTDAVDASDEQIANAIALLKHYDIIQSPVKVIQLSDELEQTLCERYDNITIAVDSPGIKIIF